MGIIGLSVVPTEKRTAAHFLEANCDDDDVYSDDGGDESDAFAEQRYANGATSKSQLL